jgi:hypothetical protein
VENKPLREIFYRILYQAYSLKGTIKCVFSGRNLRPVLAYHFKTTEEAIAIANDNVWFGCWT